MIPLLVARAVAGPVEDGAAAYEAGDLDDAIAAWSAVEGTPSGVTRYDLGTALLRKGEPLAALPHLVAAARYRPRDGQVHHNLAVARATLRMPDRDGAPPPKLPEPAPLAPGLARVASPGELAGLGLALSAVGSGLAWARERVGRVPVAALLAAGVTLAALGLWEDRALRAHPLAVVTTATVLRDAPAPEAAGLAPLPAGAEVRVERDLGAFRLVVDGEGRRGFVPAESAPTAW